ncbi:MAG: hypothetical protein PF549_01590 [Patescibacteria group bacterium]|jgi:hypothetical protein|nr:hypothetical protein [Patescibacteria group bacterium]
MSLKTFFLPLAIIITVFLVIWVIAPQWGIIQEKKVELGKETQALASLETKIKKIDESILTYRENAKDATIIYNALPANIDNDGFVDELFNGAKSKGVLITKLDISEAELADKKDKSRKNIVVIDKDDSTEENPPAVDIFKVSFSVDLVGNYTETKNFVAFLESANRLFAVEDLKISQPEEGSGTVNTSLQGIAFYKKDNPGFNASAVVNNSNDLVLNDIVKSGLGVDFINKYKQRIANKNYSFVPVITGIGKDDLFSNQNSGSTNQDDPSVESENVGNSNDVNSSPENNALITE